MLHIKITLKRPKQKRSLVIVSSPLDMNHADMKRLWEAEQTLNALVLGTHWRIDVEEE